MTISCLSKAQRLLALIGIVFLWPALLNGVPFFFPDTTAYIRSADALVHSVTHHATEWTDTSFDAPPAVAPSPGAAPAPAAPPKTILLGRSIYYGLLLYPAALTGWLEAPIVLQALLAGLVLVGAIRHLADPAKQSRRFVAMCLAGTGLAALTALPWFVCFLMPDVFAGLLIVAATVVLCGWWRERRSWRIFWIAFLVLCALVHSSHILLLGALAVVSVLLSIVLRRPVAWLPVLLIAACAGAGLAGEAAFRFALTHALHREAVRPPFLSARLIADGPGRAYLHDTCPQSGFALCARQDRRADDSDSMLWSGDPHKGIFMPETPAEQVRIAGEDGRFAAAVFAHDPLWTGATMLRNFATQARMVGLADFGSPVLVYTMLSERSPPEVRARIAASPTEQGRLPSRWFHVQITLACLAALAILLASLFDRARPEQRLPILFLLAALVLNAAICGTLSTPHFRYEDRVAWLLPVAALLVLLGRFWKPRRDTPARA